MGILVILKFAFFGVIGLVGFFIVSNIILNLRRMKNREVQPVQRVEDIIDNSPIKDKRDLPDLTEIHRDLGISESFLETVQEPVTLPDLSVEYVKKQKEQFIDPKYDFTDDAIVLTFPVNNPPNISYLQSIAGEYSKVLFEGDMIAYPRMFPEVGAVPWIVKFKFITDEVADELELKEILKKSGIFHKTLDNREVYPAVTRDGDDLIFDIKNCPVTQTQIENGFDLFSATFNKNYTLVLKESPMTYRMINQKPRNDRLFPFGTKVAGNEEKLNELLQMVDEKGRELNEEVIYCGEIQDPRVSLPTQVIAPINSFVHGVVPGQSGSGKSTSLISFILLNALINKKLYGSLPVFFFADGKSGGDYDLLAKFLSTHKVAKMASGSDPMIELANVIRMVWREYIRRQELFQKARDSGKAITNIFEYREQVGPLPRWFLFIDEFKAFIRDMDFDKLKNSPGSIPYMIDRLLAESRSSGFTIVFASQRYQQDTFPPSFRSNLNTLLIHNLKPGDQPVLSVELPPDMKKGEYLFRMEGLSCPNTNISDINCRLPYIGKASEVEKILSNNFEQKEHDSFDYELIYNRGEVDNMSAASTSQKWSLIKKLFIKEQGFEIQKQFTEDHRVDTMDICAHLKHPEFPNGIGFGILEDKNELSQDIAKRNNRQLQAMGADLYVFFLDFELPGKTDPTVLWKSEGLIPKNFCFVQSSQYLKPLKKALADFDLQVKNNWFYELIQDLKNEYLKGEANESTEEVLRKMGLMSAKDQKPIKAPSPVAPPTPVIPPDANSIPKAPAKRGRKPKVKPDDNSAVDSKATETKEPDKE